MTTRKHIRPLGNDPMELLKYIAASQVEQLHVASVGEISSLNPAKFLARVMLQPLGVETGWLPIGTIYGGPGYGIVGLPLLGAQVLVLFDGGDLNCGKIIMTTFNEVDKPPAIEPGQLLISTASDAQILLGANGEITLNGGTQAVARVGDTATGTVTIAGTTYPVTVTIQTGNTTVLA